MPVFKVTLRGQLYGSVHENVVHVKNDTEQVPSLNAIATSFQNTWLQQMKTLHTTQLVYSSIVVQNLSEPQVAPLVWPVNITGTIAADSDILPFAAQVFQFRTNTAGRKGRGRYYLGAIPTVAHASGLLTAARVSATQPVITALQAAYVAATPSSGVRLVIHATRGEALDPPVTDILVRAVMGVQRRRNIGIGT